MWTNFVDDVFVINLPKREERLKDTTAELSKHNIRFTKWEAIFDEDGKKGLRRTMTDLLRHCVNKKYERICVFEDDVKIVQPDFNELAEKCISQLPKYFDLFYFGGNVWKRPFRFTDNLLIAPAIYSTHAMIYSRKSMEYILWQINSNKPYDTILVETIQTFGRCFCAYPLLMTQRDGYSDIEKRVVNYDVFIEKRYKQRTNGIMT